MGWALRLKRRLASFMVTGMRGRFSSVSESPFCLRSQEGEESKSGHGQCHVPVPGGVAADLIVVESGFVLRGLKALLDHPPASRDPYEFPERVSGWTEADVVGGVLGVGDAAPRQQPVVAVLAPPGPDRCRGPVVLAWTASTVAAAHACPRLLGEAADQLVCAGLTEETPWS